MDRFASPLFALLSSFSAKAPEVVSRPEWLPHFQARGVRGTFVLFEPAMDRYLVVNETRARQRFLPASTFVIANALVGLEVGAIDDENEVFRWDGRAKPLAAWERDHTLQTGVRESVAWMFQEVARRVGRERMSEWLERLEYGNADIRGGIDLFWLQGALRVSAMEQVDFLRNLAEGALPMTQRSQRLVRRALEIERTPRYTLYAKPGTAAAGGGVAWWVGWVEKKGRPAAYFAMNYIPTATSRCKDRFAISRAILAEARILPSESPPS